MSKPLKREIKLQKDFEKTQSSHFTKLYLNVFNKNFKLEKKKEREEQLLIASCLTFRGINIALTRFYLVVKYVSNETESVGHRLLQSMQHFDSTS